MKKFGIYVVALAVTVFFIKFVASYTQAIFLAPFPAALATFIFGLASLILSLRGAKFVLGYFESGAEARNAARAARHKS